MEHGFTAVLSNLYMLELFDNNSQISLKGSAHYVSFDSTFYLIEFVVSQCPTQPFLPTLENEHFLPCIREGGVNAQY